MKQRRNRKTETKQVARTGRAGRPVGSTKLQATEDTVNQIKGLARIQCTQKEAAAVLGVHVDTFSDFLRANKNALEAWEDGRQNGLASLRRNQFKTAETNPTMQIWLGKQYLGQKDAMQLGGDPDNPISFVHEVLGSLDGASRGLPLGVGGEDEIDARSTRLAS